MNFMVSKSSNKNEKKEFNKVAVRISLFRIVSFSQCDLCCTIKWNQPFQPMIIQFFMAQRHYRYLILDQIFNRKIG